MKTLFRHLLINGAALWITSYLLPGFVLEGGFKTLFIGAVAFMFINILIVPLLKIMFLPLNLLTFGFFSWVINVIALYVLTNLTPQLKLVPYMFNGFAINGFILPSVELNVFYVAVLTSFLIGLIVHFLQWVVK